MSPRASTGRGAPSRRDGGAGDGRRDVDEARPHFGEIARERDLLLLRFSGFEVVKKDGAELLIDDGAGTGGGGLQVFAFVVDRFAHLMLCQVVLEEGEGAVAVGEEVDGIAGPHGIEVVRILARDFFDGGIGEGGDIDVAGAAAAIALPHIEGGLEGRVGDAFFIRRKGAGFSLKERDGFGEPAIARDGEKLIGVVDAQAARTEENAGAIGGPADRDVRGGVPSEAFRNAAGGGDGEDVDVAVVFARESDGFAVGEKMGLLSAPTPEVRRWAWPPPRCTVQRSPA